MWWMDRRRRVCIIPNNFMNVKCKCTDSISLQANNKHCFNTIDASLFVYLFNRGERGRRAMIIHVADIWRMIHVAIWREEIKIWREQGVTPRYGVDDGHYFVLCPCPS